MHYDCVTVVTPAAGSGPQMIHVFLGLITSAEDGTVGRVPVVRRRIAEILLRAGVRADSHSGRRLMAALRTLPRDELLEAPTARPAAPGPARRRPRRATGTVGVFARIHLNRDFVGVLVYFPADRFGPETAPQGRRRSSAATGPGEVIGRDDRIVEMNLARMQLLIAVRPGRAAAVARARRWSRPRSPRSPAAGATTCRTCSPPRSATTPAERLWRRYRDALPEAYKEDFDAATAVARPASGSRSCPPDNGLAFDLYTPRRRTTPPTGG